jgi:hypothetical protein
VYLKKRESTSALATAGKLRELYDATVAGRNSGEGTATLMHTSHTADELNNVCRGGGCDGSKSFGNS